MESTYFFRDCKERTVIYDGYKENTIQVTMYRNYRNFQTWYEIEKFHQKEPFSASYTTSREYYDTDRAFNELEWLISKYNLIDVTPKEHEEIIA